ncbi:hypothetical protein IPdc08_00309 [archaeon]|nr:hypothetical protein IPdc08_00309 [archaeon]
MKRLKDLDIGTDELALVFDRGNNRKGNIDKAMENVHIIGSARRSQVKEMFQVHFEGYNELYTSNAGVHILGYRNMAELFGRGFSVVVSYNPATHKNQEKTYEKRKERLVKTLDAIKGKMKRKGKDRKLTKEP